MARLADGLGSGAWPRTNAWLRANAPGLLLAAVAMAWRAAVRARSLVTFDAGLHANALVRYDIPSGQPHPPGYPLSVLAGHAVDLATRDPVAAMVWLSILWTGLTVFLLWRLGDAIAGRPAGIAAAVLFTLSPLALFNGSVGLTYAADAAMGTCVATASWHAARDPRRRPLLVLGAVLALAVGVRPSLLVFLGPMALWPALRARRLPDAASRLAWVAAAAAPVALAWMVPMVLLGGGLGAILAADHAQSATVILHDPVWRAGWATVPEHLGHLVDYAAPELDALAWLAAAIVAAAAIAGRRAVAACVTTHVRGAVARAAFLALWAVPALTFYLLVYVGWPVYPRGYLMVVLPAACVLLGAMAAQAIRTAGSSPRRNVALLAAAALLLVPAVHAPAAYHDATRLTREADSWSASYAGFADACPPATCAILMTESWQHVKLHHPDNLAFVRARYDAVAGGTVTRGIVSQDGRDDPRWFELLAMDPDQAPVHAIPPWVTRVMVHEGHPYTGTERFVKDDVALHDEVLPSGRVVHWFEPDPRWRAIESYFYDVDAAWAEAKLAQQEGRA